MLAWKGMPAVSLCIGLVLVASLTPSQSRQPEGLLEHLRKLRIVITLLDSY
jgi:hypothetical protein